MSRLSTILVEAAARNTDNNDKSVVVYNVIRNKDISGISGTGKVAECVQFSNGKCAISWVKELPDGRKVPSTTVYDSLDDVIKIHGHDGATQFIKVV